MRSTTVIVFVLLAAAAAPGALGCGGDSAGGAAGAGGGAAGATAGVGGASGSGGVAGDGGSAGGLGGSGGAMDAAAGASGTGGTPATGGAAGGSSSQTLTTFSSYGMIDDFEDGNLVLALHDGTTRNGYWYSFPMPATMVAKALPDLHDTFATTPSKKGLHVTHDAITGDIHTGWGFAWSAMLAGTQQPYNMSKWDGVTFFLRSARSTEVILTIGPEGKAIDYRMQPTDEWKQYVVRWSDFTTHMGVPASTYTAGYREIFFSFVRMNEAADFWLDDFAFFKE